MKPIPHSRPWITRADEAAVVRVLRSGRLAEGPEVAALEAEFAASSGYRHAVAVSSGTAALHLGLRLARLAPGAPVATPSYVCASVAHAIAHAGGQPLLLDLEPGRFEPERAAWREAARRGAQAFIVPHLFGYEAAPPGLDRGAFVIDDLAMGTGLDRPRARRGQVAVYSFYATKMLAGGEGGLLATDSAALAAEARDLKAYDKKLVHRLRWNYKLTDIQAALVRSQLVRLPRMLRARRRLAERYFEGLGDLPGLSLPARDPAAVYYRFVIRSRLGSDRLGRALGGHAIETARPVHLPLHRLLRLERGSFEHTEQAFLTALSLPIYPRLPVSDIQRIIHMTRALHASGRIAGRPRP